ncbi:MAG: B12-binding domain-containing radical SAM protein [Candidatus Bathyarchaeales archaeon]
MRVCLINPPRVHPKSWGKPAVFQPLRIAYVAAVLEKEHKVHVIDAPTEGMKNIKQVDEKKYRIGLANEEIADRIKRWSPDIVGITIPFAGWSKTAFEVAATVKDVDKDIITVVDGAYPSARPSDCIMRPDVDFAIIGEAEYTMLELVNTLEQRSAQNLEKIRGLAFIENGKTVITPSRPPIQDLDSLPFPARHLLPMDLYFAAVKENPIRGEIRKPWTTVITSRGCPYNCIFCSVHLVDGRNWRARSPQNVADEIEYLIRTYNIKQIDFYDDNMTLDRKRMENICDLIMERDLDFEWYIPTGVRADTLDEPLLAKMKAAGCKRIFIAPESGAQHVVNQIVKKNLDLRKVENAVISARKAGIKVACFFIIGLIGETKEDIKATINFAKKLKKLGADRFYFSFATPIYGTELYEQAKHGGFLRKDFNDDALAAAEPLIETSEFTSDDLRELCAQANSVNLTFSWDKIMRFIQNPKKAINLILEKIEKPLRK